MSENPNNGGQFTFNNLKPDTYYRIRIDAYNILRNGDIQVIETSYSSGGDACDISTKSITISSPNGNEWGSCGTVEVKAPDDCVVTKWEYDRNVLIARNGSSSSIYFEVLKYGIINTKVKATVKCKTSGKEYIREFPITIKPLTLTCASTTNNWACNSTIQMNLENAPASVKSVTWTCSSNLQLCYSGYNSTYKYAHFVVSGTGTAWIKATYTYNNKTYSTEFTHGLTGLAKPVINIPQTCNYMPGKWYEFSVNKVSGATSYNWTFTDGGFDYPNGTGIKSNVFAISPAARTTSKSSTYEFTVKVTAKNSCGESYPASYTGTAYCRSSRMINRNTINADSVDVDMLLLSANELNLESQESAFIVYPNPATTELNITQTVSSNTLSLKQDGTIKTVDIFDVKGNKCASLVFNDAQTTATIDITDLANGTFVLVINKDSDDAQTCSFIKK